MRDEPRRSRLLKAAPVAAAAALFAAAAMRVFARLADTGGLDADLDRNASQWPGTQAEVSIAADPSHPGVVLAATMSISDGRILTMSSRDFGVSWTRVSIPRGEGSTIDNDPMVAFDRQGTAYLARIPAGPAGTGVDVLRSFDGGRTWEAPVRVSPIGRDDKVALAVDDAPGSPWLGRVYVAWKLPQGGFYTARSLDSGATFTPRQRISDAVGTGLDLAVGPDGVLYLAFSGGPIRTIRVLRSLDGGETFEPEVLAAPVRAGWYAVPRSQCIRVPIVHASIAADRSPGPHRGAVYLTWADYPPGVVRAQCPEGCGGPAVCVPNVYVSRSDDGGVSWSAPALVDDERPEEVDRYHQWVRVDPSTGAVAVAFKDSRNDASGASADVYLRRSLDGGETWQPALRLSSASSRATTGFQFGDYQSLAAEGGNVYVAWSDYRQSPTEGEIYVRRFVAPVTTEVRAPVIPVGGERPPPRERPRP